MGVECWVVSFYPLPCCRSTSCITSLFRHRSTWLLKTFKSAHDCGTLHTGQINSEDLTSITPSSPDVFNGPDPSVLVAICCPVVDADDVRFDSDIVGKGDLLSPTLVCICPDVKPIIISFRNSFVPAWSLSKVFGWMSGCCLGVAVCCRFLKNLVMLSCLLEDDALHAWRLEILTP